MNETPKTPLTDSQLDTMLAKLNDRVEPENDLWPEIKRQLPQKSVAWWQSTPAIAASFLAAVLAIGSAGVSQYQNQQLQHQLANLSQPAANAPGTSAMMPVAYQPDAGQENCAAMGPGQVIQQNLVIIQSAINEIHSALEQSPNNAALNQRLLDLSAQQVNLINRANAISL